MTYQFGKAVSGGTPLGEPELNALERERLDALYARLQKPARTDDVLDQRLAEELEYCERLLHLVEADLKWRGGQAHLAAQVAEAKGVVKGIAAIVSAEDRCEGMTGADAGLKRRLLRDTADGDQPICRRESRLRRRPATP